MLFVKNSDLQWCKDEIHDMYAGVHDNLPINVAADIMFAKIEPGHTLPIHWHTRPLCQDGTNTGYESFFFLKVVNFYYCVKKEILNMILMNHLHLHFPLVKMICMV